MGQQVSSSQDKLPYRPIREVKSCISKTHNFRWSLWDGEEVKDSRKQVSIFCLEPSSSPIVQGILTRFKRLRHPNILPCLHGLVGEEGKTYIVTNHVTPLENHLATLTNTEEILMWGIFQIATAMAFLNKSCNVIHGNINISSIYVTQQGDWQLGGFELASTLEEVQSGSALLFNPSDLSYNLQWPPEVLAPPEKRDPVLAQSGIHAIDTWLLGVFIWTLYNPINPNSHHSFDKNLLKDMSKLPPSIRDDYVKLLSGSPRNRLETEKFLDSPAFRTPFISACLFLDSLTIKDNVEKEKFFKSLPSVAPLFPENMVKYKVIPALTTGLTYGAADHHALAALLPLTSKLNSDEFKSQITPSLLKWFAAPDRTLRVCLLSNLETFLPHLDMNQVETIWPPLTQGFTDSTHQLRELTVKSLIQLAPKLKEKILNGDMLSFIASLQVDPVPAIRCNTTVVLGKISSHLTPSVRDKVLLKAFTRMMRDPFPPSRKAAISACLTCHAQGYLSPTQIATKLIPELAPLTVDPELIVREAALQALPLLIATLESNSSKMPATALNPNSPGQGTENAGMFEWAIGKVFSSSTSTSKPPQQLQSTPPAASTKQTIPTTPHQPTQSKKQQSTQIQVTHQSQNPPQQNTPSKNGSSNLHPQSHESENDIPWGTDDDPVVEEMSFAKPVQKSTIGTSKSGLKLSMNQTSSNGWETEEWGSESTEISQSTQPKFTTSSSSSRLAPTNSWEESSDGWDDVPESTTPVTRSIPSSRFS